ncbi:MAG: type II toxin-antitoxin system MqsA family antitoxin [Oscillospiraceae bacterium]|nr:type II toxin-antitoxin system MqsA family antitoxin [Oscillospiraceae bacterium]
MKCFLCKSNVEDKPTTFMVDLENCIVIVKNVPSQVCGQCGETSYNNDVAHRLEKIVNDMRKAVTEVAIINYADKVVA